MVHLLLWAVSFLKMKVREPRLQSVNTSSHKPLARALEGDFESTRITCSCAPALCPLLIFVAGTGLFSGSGTGSGLTSGGGTTSGAVGAGLMRTKTLGSRSSGRWLAGDCGLERGTADSHADLLTLLLLVLFAAWSPLPLVADCSGLASVFCCWDSFGSSAFFVFVINFNCDLTVLKDICTIVN